jgi:hypothetical protein
MKKIFILFLLVFTFSGCINDTPCTFDGFSSITVVTGPESIQLNQTIEFQVFHNPEFGCSTDRGFDVVMQNNIVFIAQKIRTECNCSTDPETIISTFRFTPISTGNVTFRFRTDEDNFIVRNVVVE